MNIKFISLMVSYLFTLLVTRNFGSAAWGEFSIFHMMLSLGGTIALLGLDTAMLKNSAVFSSLNGQEFHFSLVRKTLMIVALASLVIALVVFFSSSFIAATWFDMPSIDSSIAKAALCVPAFALLGIFSQSLRGIGKPGLYMFFNHLGRFLIPLICAQTVLLVIGHFNLSIDFFVWNLYFLALLSGVILIRGSSSGEHQKKSDVGFGLKELLWIGLPLLIANASNFLKGWMDTMMAGIYLDIEEVGMYSVALKVAKLLTIPITVVNVMIASKLASARNNIDIQSEIDKSNRTIALLTLVPFVLILLFPEQILSLFGEEFTISWKALILLAIGMFINALAGSVGLLMQMQGLQVAYSLISLVTLVAGVLLNVVLIPRYGMIGIAIVALIIQLVWNGLCVFYVWRVRKISTVVNLKFWK